MMKKKKLQQHTSPQAANHHAQMMVDGDGDDVMRGTVHVVAQGIEAVDLMPGGAI